MELKQSIPHEVILVMKKLVEAGFASYLVGGCVRDVLLGREPKDWDVATNALPEEIQKIFPESVYENKYGTVLVKTESENQKLRVIEVTTFRQESTYSDFRRPDEVVFVKNIEDDLARRDFTINAMALDLKGELVDPFGGQSDLKDKLIRAAGDPKERFQEDALRLMRAVRFACEINFEIEKETAQALKIKSQLLGKIAKERIREELIKILMTDQAKQGIELLESSELLQFIMPELREGIKIGQNKHHIYDIWEHNLLALKYAADKNYSLEIRLGALLHDVGKPRTKKGDGLNSTFYAHEIVGAKMTKKMLEELRFSKEIIQKVVHLVRHHLFYYNVGEVTEAGVRRFIARVGPENIDDLIKIREADRIGSGVPKAVPYKLRHLLFMIDKVRQDPISPKMLKINGDQLMEILNLKPSPRLGWLLGILLEEVLEDPKKNDFEALKKKALELNQETDQTLKERFEKSKTVKQEFEEGVEEQTKKKYYV